VYVLNSKGIEDSQKGIINTFYSSRKAGWVPLWAYFLHLN